jgi:hypothetical protein
MLNPRPGPPLAPSLLPPAYTASFQEQERLVFEQVRGPRQGGAGRPHALAGWLALLDVSIPLLGACAEHLGVPARRGGSPCSVHGLSCA